jgi:hypothetical protein
VQSTAGQRLFAPLFVDLERGRLAKPATWRQLTVGQHRGIVPAAEAAGYRVQVGKSQWLVYRSLAPPEIRTVLGQNIKCEFMLSQFGRDGQIEELLEIE